MIILIEKINERDEKLQNVIHSLQKKYLVLKYNTYFRTRQLIMPELKASIEIYTKKTLKPTTNGPRPSLPTVPYNNTGRVKAV